MSNAFAHLTFTPSVQSLQARGGSRARYARIQARAPERVALSREEVDLLSQADTFFLATVGESGWPYVQHRGGPRGFLQVLTPTRIGYAELRGNLQYISAGNAAANPRAALIVMDYARQRRLKLMGTLQFAEIDEPDDALVRRLQPVDTGERVERLALIDVQAFDWNCPRHITQRFTRQEIDGVMRPLQRRIVELEQRLADAGIALP